MECEFLSKFLQQLINESENENGNSLSDFKINQLISFLNSKDKFEIVKNLNNDFDNLSELEIKQFYKDFENIYQDSVSIFTMKNFY